MCPPACAAGITANECNAIEVVAEPLAEPFHGLYRPSDHGGVLAELTCG